MIARSTFTFFVLLTECTVSNYQSKYLWSQSLEDPHHWFSCRRGQGRPPRLECRTTVRVRICSPMPQVLLQRDQSDHLLTRQSRGARERRRAIFLPLLFFLNFLNLLTTSLMMLLSPVVQGAEVVTLLDTMTLLLTSRSWYRLESPFSDRVLVLYLLDGAWEKDPEKIWRSWYSFILTIWNVAIGGCWSRSG